MSASMRTGSHPMDPVVGSSGMLGWVGPAIGLTGRRLWTTLPATILVVMLVLTIPYWSRVLPRNPGAFTAWLLDLLATSVAMGIMAFGYVLLCRKEGQPYGVGGHLSAGEMALRLLPMVLFWAVLTTGLSWVLQGMARSPGFLQLAGPFLSWLMRTFGPLNAMFVLTWLFLPPFIVLGSTQILCNTMCIRTRLPLGEVLREAFGRVFSQLGRLILPGMLVSAVVLVMLRALLEALNGPILLWMVEYRYFTVTLILVPLLTLILAWWFVLERAYVPESGVEDELTPPVLPTPGAARHASDTSLEASNAAMALQVARRQIEQKLKLEDPDGAMGYFVEWVSGRTRSVPDLQTLLPLFESHRDVLLPRLSALVVDLVRNNRMFEAIELTRHGLSLEPRFLADQPDMLPAYAKRLVASEHPDLALRLLATYVRAHRQHAGFLGGGLLLARLLISHANQPEAARKLLEHLRTQHPNEPQIAILLRQLGPTP